MRVLVAAAALLATAPALPVSAHVVEVNAQSSYAVGTDGAACFELAMAGPISGVAGVVGMVRTDRPLVGVLYRGTTQLPTNYYTDHQVFSTVYDYHRVCVAGAGRTAFSGSAVYTLAANGRQGEIAIVLHCTFSRSGPSCS